MKMILCLLFLIAFHSIQAHDHVDVGRLSSSSTQLALDGPNEQLALYVPPKEFFSGYMLNFPGGCHATELTFTTETSAIEPAPGADPRIELVEVTGPQGGTFSFWEAGSTTPTWSRPTGWSASQSTAPFFQVLLNGSDHVHGRAFSADKPGTYHITFRAVDMNGIFSSSDNKTIIFNALQPPKLSISVANAMATLTFTSREGLVYDLQVCTDLASGVWTNVEPHTALDGHGQVITMSDAVALRTKAFYRLVEYY
jgi:hypothetical protein